jgi:flagellar basal body-associated protein FliL
MKNNNGKKLAIAVLVIVVLALVSEGVYYVWSKSHEEAEKVRIEKNNTVFDDCIKRGGTQKVFGETENNTVYCEINGKSYQYMIPYGMVQ